MRPGKPGQPFRFNALKSDYRTRDGEHVELMANFLDGIIKSDQFGYGITTIGKSYCLSNNGTAVIDNHDPMVRAFNYFLIENGGHHTFASTLTPDSGSIFPFASKGGDGRVNNFARIIYAVENYLENFQGADVDTLKANTKLTHSFQKFLSEFNLEEALRAEKLSSREIMREISRSRPYFITREMDDQETDASFASSTYSFDAYPEWKGLDRRFDDIFKTAKVESLPKTPTPKKSKNSRVQEAREIYADLEKKQAEELAEKSKSKIYDSYQEINETNSHLFSPTLNREIIASFELKTPTKRAFEVISPEDRKKGLQLSREQYGEFEVRQARDMRERSVTRYDVQTPNPSPMKAEAQTLQPQTSSKILK